MLDFGLGGTASPGLGQLLARRIVGSTSVRDVEAEGIADVHLSTHERCDELDPALVLNAADGTHLCEDALNRRELGPQVLVLLVERAYV